MDSLLPYAMQDESNLALEECINHALDIDMTNFLTTIVDNLSDAVLYEKAKMFHITGIEGWNDCKTRAERESLVKNAIRIHRSKGTVSSIKSRLNGTVIEYHSWQEYGGIPNHFRIKVLTEEMLDVQTYKKILTAVEEFKRLSSKQDKIEVQTLIKDQLNLNSLLFLSRKLLIK